ncbi:MULTISPECIES: hypothetical protein [unclassified Sporosarcina]|uniref:hypothetical protein n=1 Tax=unclassified Sporosarcina TaxID=2647733 RepID=UPI000C16D022|nr:MULTISPECIES: hypothetical protein [unclassified Sporosarcina]PID19563.1 hypothetical protein CSV62_03420 [Sporosarcina sp. P35]
MMEKNYSPSDLKEWHEAPRNFKALMNGCISYKLEQLEEERAKVEKMNKEGGKK